MFSDLWLEAGTTCLKNVINQLNVVSVVQSINRPIVSALGKMHFEFLHHQTLFCLKKYTHLIISCGSSTEPMLKITLNLHLFVNGMDGQRLKDDSSHVLVSILYLLLLPRMQTPCYLSPQWLSLSDWSVVSLSLRLYDDLFL